MDQAAALPFRLLPGVANIAGEAIDILLVTSRDTGRWVLPKGNVESGEMGPDTARREAEEEAGVSGPIKPSALGQYHYCKGEGGPDDPALRVSVFALHVRELAEDWPERKQRTRQWFSRAAAIEAVDEAELKQLIAGFFG